MPSGRTAADNLAAKRTHASTQADWRSDDSIWRNHWADTPLDLRIPSDWTRWYNTLIAHAQEKQIWVYIDPDARYHPPTPKLPMSPAEHQSRRYPWHPIGQPPPHIRSDMQRRGWQRVHNLRWDSYLRRTNEVERVLFNLKEVHAYIEATVEIEVWRWARDKGDEGHESDRLATMLRSLRQRYEPPLSRKDRKETGPKKPKGGRTKGVAMI